MAYLVSIIRDKTNTKMQRHKTIHGLSGDVYLITPGNTIESLASHKQLFPESTATTIEEAAAYHVEYLNNLVEQRRQAAAAQADDTTDDTVS